MMIVINLMCMDNIQVLFLFACKLINERVHKVLYICFLYFAFIYQINFHVQSCIHNKPIVHYFVYLYFQVSSLCIFVYLYRYFIPVLRTQIVSSTQLGLRPRGACMRALRGFSFGLTNRIRQQFHSILFFHISFLLKHISVKKLENCIKKIF